MIAKESDASEALVRGQGIVPGSGQGRLLAANNSSSSGIVPENSIITPGLSNSINSCMRARKTLVAFGSHRIVRVRGKSF